jgi:hypothetical protein
MTTTTISSNASCWARFWWEMLPSYPLFSLDEPTLIEYTDGADTQSLQLRQIHVAASFAPSRPLYLTSWIRLMLLLWALHVLYIDVSSYPPHNLYIYMGYLTHWGHVLSILYLTASFLCTIIPGAVQQPQQPSKDTAESGSVSRLVRLTWGLYSTVAPLEVAITLLYWSAISTGEFRYITVMEHGGIAAFVWFDGLVVGLVPVRAKHIAFLMVVCASYLIWTVIDAVLDIGSGEWGPAYDDDALYPVLNWKTDSKGAAMVAAFAICVLSPCLFMGCWMLSLMSSRSSRSSTIGKISDADMSPNNGFCCHNYDGSRRPLYPLLDVNDADSSHSAFNYNALGCIEVV